MHQTRENGVERWRQIESVEAGRPQRSNGQARRENSEYFVVPERLGARARREDDGEPHGQSHEDPTSMTVEPVTHPGDDSPNH